MQDILICSENNSCEKYISAAWNVFPNANVLATNMEPFVLAGYENYFIRMCMGLSRGAVSSISLLAERDYTQSFRAKLDDLQRLDYRYASLMADRILELSISDDDDEEDESHIDLTSFGALINFFASKKASRLKKPAVMLVNGQLRAEWNISARKFVGLRFKANNDYKFVIITPKLGTEKFKVTTGDVNADEFFRLVDPVDWLHERREVFNEAPLTQWYEPAAAALS